VYAQRGEDNIEKKTKKKQRRKIRKKIKEKNRGDERSKKTKERTKKKPRIEGGEIEKRGRRRAFFCWCLHCYLRLQLHLVKSSSSLCFCVIVAKKQCQYNLITFILCSARVG